ncbi:MAG: type III pantothenate kinase [Bacteroidota bacterium]
MQLIIDRGNSFWKIAIFDENNIVFSERLEKVNSLVFDSILNQFNVESGIISSVSYIDEEIIAFLKSKLFLVEFTQQTKVPIQIDYQTPETLGKDRIAAAVGAFSQWGNENCLIIDAGTCITYDILEKGGKYVGGSISPGIQMRFRALNNFTGKLPLIEIKKFENTNGKTTEESILSGVLKGVCFEVDGFISHYTNEINSLKIIFTGGDVVFFDKNLKNSIFVDSNLVITGLKEILKYNA